MHSLILFTLSILVLLIHPLSLSAQNIFSLSLDVNSADSLGKASGTPITRAEMASLTRLEVPNKNISNLTGLEFATALTWLDLGEEVVDGVGNNSNEISNLSSLSGLTNLTYLNLRRNMISDVSVLSNLTSLTELNLAFNMISDMSVESVTQNLNHFAG